MFHRFSTWWRALSVVLLSLATVTWPSAAQAGTTPSFVIAHQDAVATLNAAGASHFNATLDLSLPRRGLRVQLLLYPRLVTRSQITPLVNGSGDAGSPIAATAPFALTCNTRQPVTMIITLITGTTGRATNHCTSLAPRLHVPCSAQSCDGVYPLRYTVTGNGATRTEWSMIAIQASRVATPLRVNFIMTLSPSSWHQVGRTIAVLKTVARYPQVPVTFGVDYRTLNKALADVTATTAAWRGALTQALASPLHQASGAPPSTIDFGGLVASGLTSQVSSQINLADQLLSTLNGHSLAGAEILSGVPSNASLDALAGAGVTQAVIPETTLTEQPSSTLFWGAPFHLSGIPSLTLLTTDNPLSQLITDSSIEPGRRAAMTLATLAFLHFEEPNAPASRAVVVVVPVDGAPAKFIADLLGGLSHNPFFIPGDLAPSFNPSLVATNGAPASRALLTAKSSTWTPHNITSLRALVTSVASYDRAVTSDVVVAALHIAVAGSEVSGNSDARQTLINNALTTLDAQLSQFSVDTSVITLAGPGTSLPITLISKANYTVTAVVHLITDRLIFPKGKNLVVTLDSPTKSIRIPTSNHQGSSLTLQVEVTTPDSKVVLARAAIQVRIAGASLVGYLMTLASVLVLALWWWRTYSRRSKGRHAR